MSTYADLAKEIEAIEKLGKWIALSGSFGTSSESVGCIIAAHCFIEGIPLLKYQQENGMVKGTPYKPYDAMLAAFHKEGGKSEIIQRTPEVAAVRLTKDGKSYDFSLTWEDAQKEPFVYNGKESDVVALLAKGKTPPLKAKYATPRSRATMLFARVVSDGIRAVDPGCNFGTYTPEELSDMHDGEVGNVIEGKITDQSKPKERPVQQAPPEAENSTTQQVQQVEQPVATQTESQPAQSEATADPLAMAGPATERHRQEILDLMKRLKQEGVDDIGAKVKGKLQAAGLAAITDLTVQEAESLIRALQTKEIHVWIDSAITGHKGNSQGE